MKNFLRYVANFFYHIIIPFTNLPFLVLTILAATINLLYFYTSVDIEIEMIMFTNVLWGLFYSYTIGLYLSKE